MLEGEQDPFSMNGISHGERAVNGLNSAPRISNRGHFTVSCLTLLVLSGRTAVLRCCVRRTQGSI